MATSRSIHVLHVDDDSDFLQLAERQLEGSDRLVVETETDPLAGLDRLDKFDCVVVDYKMSGMDGLSFLQSVRETHSMPVVFFTGAGSETVASEAITLGVTDYLQKTGDSSAFDILRNRIEYLVDKQRAEAAAEAAEQRIREVYERITVAFFAVDDDWQFTYLNDEAEALFEAREDELLGTSLWDGLSDLRDTDAEAQLRTALDQQEQVACEAELASLDKYVELYAYPDDSGVSVFVEDVTAARKQEAEIESLRSELEISEEQFRTLRQKLSRPSSPFR
jgi:PAS domain S-box-containing protein